MPYLQIQKVEPHEPAALNLGAATSYDLNPPATIRDIQFCAANGIGINSAGTSAKVLISSAQWQQWHQHYPIVTCNYIGTTNTSVWHFQQETVAGNSIIIDTGTTASSSIIYPATNSFMIQGTAGNVIIVPDQTVQRTPGTIIPWNAQGVPAERWAPGIQFPPPSAEERRIRREYEEQTRRYREENNAAFLRAEQLLRQYLNREQRREWLQDKQFHVQVGDRRYRIKSGRIGNVELVNRDGVVLERYCCHPVEMVPTGDCVLAQMLMLMYQEDEFLRLANVQYTAPGFEGQKRRLRFIANDRIAA